MTKLELLVNLGYKVDPFKKARFDTGDSLRVRRILAMAVESNAMVSIVGERGVGKSEAINAALHKLGVRRVDVARAQKEKISIADIETAIILDLSDEAPLGRGETRSRQLRRIVGAASQKEKIVVCIEEAQRLHGATLKSLKTLREIEWMGERELFTVVLIGQSDPMNRPGVSEVRLRTDLVRMQGLFAGEAVGYVKATLGKHFEEEAIEALAGRPQSTNYLELQELCIAVLNYAWADGRQMATVGDVEAVGGAPKATALPKGLAKKQPVAALSAKDALKEVQARRAGGEVELKEVSAC